MINYPILKARSYYLLFASFICLVLFIDCATSNRAKLQDKEMPGVKIGAITYSWRDMSWDATDILKFCKEAGITSLEMMGSVAED